MWSLILRLTILLFTFCSGVTLSNVLAPHLPVKVASEVKVEPVIVPVVATRSEPLTVVNYAPSPMVILDFDPNKFVPDGSYLLLGKKPKEFADFQVLYIETYEGKDGYRTGDVFIGSRDSDRDYEQQSAVFVLIRDKQVLLVTKPNKTGFEYRFDGEFLRGGVVADAGEGKAVISGRLTKTKNGRRIAERVVQFQVEQHGC